MRLHTCCYGLILAGWALAPIRTAAADTSLPAPRAEKRVVVIPVQNEVDEGMYAFLKRATAQALQTHPDYLVYKVDTYGGELQAAFDIVDLLLSVKPCSTYVFVDKKAISAGALISLSCNRMAMAQGTTIGDCAPIMQGGQSGIIMLGEKIQSPLRAKFRNLAERNGYPNVLSQAMVTADGAVEAFPKAKGPPRFFTAKQWNALSAVDKKAYSDHKIIVPDGQLLTLTDEEAQHYGFSQGSFPDLAAFLRHKGWRETEVMSTTWSEDLARVLGRFTPLLMLIGFGALYLEFKAPGHTIFAVIGITCLAVAFGSKYAVGLANHTELLLLLAGVVLFLVEIYLFPGTLIAGTVGLALMMVALTLSFQSFTVPNPRMPWQLREMLHNVVLTLGMAALAFLIPVGMLRFVLPHLSGRVRIIPDTTLAGAHAAPESALPTLGARGTVKTTLRPAGKAVFDGLTLEVTSRGEFIPPGSVVEVCRVQGLNLVVRPVEDQPA